MGIGKKIKDFITPLDEEEEVLEVFDDEEGISTYEKPKSKAVSRIAGEAKMVLFEPRSFEEAEEIATRLKENRAAVVNLHKLQRDYAQRTIDFLRGVIFALDGTIQKIGHDVVLCTPKNVSVQGEIDVEGNEE